MPIICADAGVSDNTDLAHVFNQTLAFDPNALPDELVSLFTLNFEFILFSWRFSFCNIQTCYVTDIAYRKACAFTHGSWRQAKSMVGRW